MRTSDVTDFFSSINKSYSKKKKKKKKKEGLWVRVGPPLRVYTWGVHPGQSVYLCR